MDNMTVVVATSIVIGVAVGFAYWASKHLPDIGEFGDANFEKKSMNLTHATHAFLQVKNAHLLDPDTSRFSLVTADDETWTWLLVGRDYVSSVYQSITKMDGNICKVCVLIDSMNKVFIVNDESVRTLYLFMATNSIDLNTMKYPQNTAKPLSYHG